MAFLFSKRHFLAQIMHIASGTMYDFSQHALVNHMHGHHLIPAITAILHQHNRCFSLFIGLYKPPTFPNGIGSSDLASHCLATLHRFDSQVDMGLPGTAKKDGIHLFPFKDLLIICCLKWLLSSLFLNILGRLFASVLIHITDRTDYGVFMLQQNVVQQKGSPCAKSD